MSNPEKISQDYLEKVKPLLHQKIGPCKELVKVIENFVKEAYKDGYIDKRNEKIL